MRGEAHRGDGQLAFGRGIDGDCKHRVVRQSGEPGTQVGGALKRRVIARGGVLHGSQVPRQTEELQLLVHLAEVVDVGLATLQGFERELHGHGGVDGGQALT